MIAKSRVFCTESILNRLGAALFSVAAPHPEKMVVDGKFLGRGPSPFETDVGVRQSTASVATEDRLEPSLGRSVAALSALDPNRLPPIHYGFCLEAVEYPESLGYRYYPHKKRPFLASSRLKCRDKAYKMGMLEKIVSSRTRAEILRLLFGLQAKEVHMRDLERQTHLAIGTIQRELKTLSTLELIRARRDGNPAYPVAA